MKIYRGVAELIDIPIDDATVLKHKLLGEHKVNAAFTLESYVDIQIGDYINFGTVKYTALAQPIVKKDAANEFVYNVDFMAPQYDYSNALFMHDGLTDFFFMGRVEEFLILIRDNMNRASGGASYTLGTFPTTGYKNIGFDGDTCLSALQKVCTEFDLEYKISDDGLSITVADSLGTATGLTFEFKVGLRNIERKHLSDSDLVTRLYPYGSTRNIIHSTYGSARLEIAPAQKYLENNVAQFGVIERAKIWEDIYPRRQATITAVDGADPEKFTDATMDFDLNAQLSSSTAKVTFNSGLLSGYEFEVEKYDDATKEFTIISITDDQDTTLPNATQKPAIGDEYVIHDIVMPQTYIDAAEAELMTAASNYLTEFSQPNVVYDISPDPIYFEENGVVLSVGDLVDITDSDFGITITTKIIEITRSLANPYLYTLRVGNNATISLIGRIQAGLRSNTDTIVRNEVDRTVNRLRTQQRINDLNTITDSIFDVSGDYFDPTKIKPLSIETGALSVGAKPLSMNFEGLEIERNYQGDPDKVRVSDATMVHFTINPTPTEWTITGNTFDIPDTAARYLYVVVNDSNNLGSFVLDTVQRQIDHEANKYTFLVGVIHAQANGTRGMSMLYGQTFINGKFITTGVIQDISGLNFFDLDEGKFKIGNATSSLDWNVTTANQLTLKGTLVQSQSGDEFPQFVYRGEYDNAVVYYKGDGVKYQGKTWLYVSDTSAAGNVPAENAIWDLIADSGADGSDGAQGPQGAQGAQGETGPTGPQGPQGPQGPAGADGINGSDGTNGADGDPGANAFSALVDDYTPALVGGETDFEFTLDALSGGAINQGEVRVKGSFLRKPDGVVVQEEPPFDVTVETGFGEGEAGIFYLIWSDTLSHTRISGFNNQNHHIIPVIYESGWKAIGNGTNQRYSITLQSTDVFLAAIEARQSTGGLTGFQSYAHGAKGYDAHDPANDYYSFDRYFSDDDFLQQWDSHSGAGEISFITTGAQAGRQSLKIGNNSGNDQRWLVSKRRLAYDPNAIYSVEATVERNLGSGTLYVGICGFDGDGNFVNSLGANSFSSQYYIAGSAENPPTTPKRYIGFFSGASASTNSGEALNVENPKELHEDVKYISMMFIVNYSGQSGETVVHSAAIRKISDGAALQRGGYSASIRYPVGSIVTYYGGTYVCIRENTGVYPTNDDFWRLQGQQNQALTFRGEFEAGERYYYTNNRRDVVKYSGAYYLYNVPNGSGVIESSWTSGDWVSFGATFDSIATGTLLAENANIGDWIFKSGKLTSQAQNAGSPIMELDGVNGKITAQDSVSAWWGTSTVSMSFDPSLGEFKVSHSGGGSSNGMSIEVSKSGLDVKGPGHYDSAHGYGAVVAENTSSSSMGSVTAAIIGKRRTIGIGNNYGGIFEMLRAEGLCLEYINLGGGSQYISDKDVLSVHYSGSATTLYLPNDPVPGQTHIAFRLGSGSFTVHGNGNSLWKGSAAQTSDSIGTRGRGALCIFNGTYWIYAYIGL